MDIESYISSGILELYVAGALSPAEAVEVKAMAKLYPKIRAEIDAIDETFQQAVLAGARKPRPELRQRVLDRIYQEENKANGPATIHPINADPKPAPENRWQRYLVAASLLFVLMSSAAAVYFNIQWRNTKEELLALQQENTQIADARRTLETNLQQRDVDLRVLRSPNNKIVQLKGLAPAPDALASVYWDAASRQVYLDRGTLPSPPAGKQYQLWAIAKGKPVDMGMIAKEPDARQLQQMKNIGAAEAFAVTLENEGGSASPTLEAMYVMGKL